MSKKEKKKSKQRSYNSLLNNKLNKILILLSKIKKNGV